MPGGFAYLDASAFVKLIVSEPETPALRAVLARWPARASATLLRTETMRALRRAGAERHLGAARRLLGSVQLIRVDEPLLDRAGELEPRDQRSLDAIHLAAALALGPDLGAMFVYDTRLAAAAAQVGIEVVAPA
jgi:predicted nucleic acid-binding protein